MIRLARKEDFKDTIEILELAMSDFTDFILDTKDKNKKMKLLEKYFKAKNNRLSYENILVYEEQNEIVATICFYEGWLSDFLDSPFIERLKNIGSKVDILKECKNDEFYIDSVAVKESFRGKGYFKQLMQEAIKIAKELGHSKVSLITQTPEIYERLGFDFIKNLDFYGEVYAKMVKNI
ncbi:acetyltransferase [Campylobacter blaseri]|uniref:GNAT family N-acetyltransferase n=1 Tax=Campylobacter blaseri TaxID=2042961 RepID=A0A2P8R3S1_9BACT|nr:GNAT family N-acetyltransferase [Campylobacter blaseri]PSM53152.1 GNAT family N-acetyltransferase [Campylobacter blaseri]PSM54618.1 GNAT family N-acetyltransferase [Campylobacter blaseri]QKF86905.1 acetyltransferase [Campylobacter blaseri]